MEKQSSDNTLNPLSKSFFFISGIIFFVLFGLFTLLVRADLLVSFDFDTTVKFQDYLREHLRLQEFFCSLSFFGHFEILFILLIAIIIGYFIGKKVFSKKNKESKKKNFVIRFFTTPNLLMGLISSVFLFGAAHVVEIIGKLLLHHPNPPQFFIKCHNPIFPSGYVQPGFSYPSGHSLRTVFVGIVLIFVVYKIRDLPIFLKLCIYATILAIISLMLISRVSLGEHWPTDVIGGSLLGLSFSLLSLLFL